MSDTLYEKYEDVTTEGSYRTTHWGAQTFTPSVSHNITSVELMLHQTDATSLGDVTIGIKEVDVSDHPTGGYLCSWTGTVDWGTTPGIWNEIIFGSSTPLTNGIMYAIVWSAVSAPTGKYLFIGRNNSGAYANGVLEDSTNSGGEWSSIGSIDVGFREYGLEITEGGVVPSVGAQAIIAGLI